MGTRGLRDSAILHGSVAALSPHLAARKVGVVVRVERGPVDQATEQASQRTHRVAPDCTRAMSLPGTSTGTSRSAWR